MEGGAPKGVLSNGVEVWGKTFTICCSILRNEVLAVLLKALKGIHSDNHLANVRLYAIV